jgi:hypothetical protein
MTEVKLPTSGKGAPRGKPFARGHDENRNYDGREKGSHNKTTRILKEAMLLAAAQLGDLSGIEREDLPTPNIETGKDELVGYLRWAGKCEPRSFLNILGKLLPLQVKVDSFTQTVYHSVEELQHDISQRGLNMRGFGQLLLEAHRTMGEPINAGQDNGDRGEYSVGTAEDIDADTPDKPNGK